MKSPARVVVYLLIVGLCSNTFAVPTSITYQGSLKQSGALVNGTYPMIFNVTNSDGSVVYWTSGSQSVIVKEGLYRVDLAPTSVDWANIDPYIETRVSGSILLPREKIANAPYSLATKDLQPDASAKGTLRLTGINTNSNATTGALYFYPGTTSNQIIRFSGQGPATDMMLYQPSATSDLRIGKTNGTATSDLFTFSNAGKLGIGLGNTSPNTDLDIYDTNPIVSVRQNPAVAGGAGIQLTAAGSGSSANAAYVQYNMASIWGQTNTAAFHFGPADRSTNWATLSDTELTMYGENPHMTLQRNATAGSSGIYLSAAGASSPANAAFIQFHAGGQIWGQTFGNVLHFGPNDRSTNWAQISPTGIYGPNGILLTSASRRKKDIREINFGGDKTSLVSIPTSSLGLPAFKKIVTDTSGTESIQPVTGQPETIRVPRGIVYKWKTPAAPKMADADMIGFMGDDLPIEAHGLREDGTRDPEQFYVGAVVGILCAKIRQQDATINDLLARVAQLEKVTAK